MNKILRVSFKCKISLFLITWVLSTNNNTNAQNIGIGTSVPEKPLHLRGNGELLRIQGNFPWIGFMKNTDTDYGGFLYYPDTSLVMGSRAGTNLPLVIAPNNNGLMFATASQRIGIGVPSPAEKLDVDGSINLTGSIKANGIDGTSGQVLMKNSSGNLTWGDMSEFKNMATFRSGTGASWTIPTGTKRVWVELWGGGASGIIEMGGAGGGYLSAIIDVPDPSNPGSMTYTVGTGGTGGIAGGPNLAGSATTVTYTNPAGLTLTAGGATAPAVTTFIGGGSSGSYSVFPVSFLNYFGINGSYGTGPSSQFMVSGTTTYETISFGDGGDAGNTNYTRGVGSQIVANITTSSVVRRTSSGNFGRQPGGGGASGGSPLGGGIVGVAGAGGAAGMVIFHY